MTVRLVIPALLPLLLLGCFGLDVRVDLMPDGSGKLIAEGVLIKNAPDNWGATWPDLAQLERSVDGIDLWLAPSFKSGPNQANLTMVGYFSDVNKLRIWKEALSGDEGKKKKDLAIGFEYAKESGRYKLTVVDNWLKEEAKFPDADWKPNGHWYGLHLTVPGSIKESSGVLSVKAQTLSASVDDETLSKAKNGDKEAADKLEKLNGTITSKGEVQLDEARVSAFKKEFAEAKENWKSLREKWLERNRRDSKSEKK